MSMEEKQDLEEFMKILKINFKWSIIDSNGKSVSSHQSYLQLGMEENSVSMDDVSEDGVSRTWLSPTSPPEILSSPVGHSNSLLDSPDSLNKMDDDDFSEDGVSTIQFSSTSPPEILSSPSTLLRSPDSSNLSNVHNSPAVNDVSRSSSLDERTASEVSGPRLSENRMESVIITDPVTRISGTMLTSKSPWYWYKPVTISSGENIKIKLGVANNEDHSQTDTSDTSDTNNNHQNDKDVKAYLIGFKNQGNTCYINASMQATIGLCFFVQRIISTFDGKRIVHLSIKFTKFSCSSGWSWELIILFCVPMQNSEEWKPSKC